MSAPPGWSVKYVGNGTGIGNGGRSVGTPVRLTWVTAWPSRSRITVPAGMWISSPGTLGLVTTTSLVVGEGIVAACAMSSAGIQLVYGSTVVRLGVTNTETS